MAPQRKLVYVDTAGLWSLEALIEPKRFRSPQWREYLANLFDYIVDPQYDVRCIVPSAERLGGPLPTFYTVLLEAGLVSKTDIMPADEFHTPDRVVAAQFREFSRHVMANRNLVESWFQLHNNKSIRNGWLIGLPAQSPWPGVQNWLHEHLETDLKQPLDRLVSATGWTTWQTAMSFALIQRGYSYGLTAAVRGAEYFTHPARWQVLPNSTSRQGEHIFGEALGAIIVEAIEKRYLSRNAQAISQALAGFRERMLQHGAQRNDVHSKKDAIEFLLALTPGLIGATLKPQFDKFVKNLAILILAHGVAAYSDSALSTEIATIGGLLLVQPSELVLSPIEAYLCRRWVDYSVQVNLPIETCRYDGAALVGGACPVCAARQREEGTIYIYAG